MDFIEQFMMMQNRLNIFEILLETRAQVRDRIQQWASFLCGILNSAHKLFWHMLYNDKGTVALGLASSVGIATGYGLNADSR
jgi:hypothetical protein